MQAIMETAFDTVYLIGVVVLGILILKNSKQKQYKAFGWMAIILGLGDSFHLIPRAYALLTTGLQANAIPLGIGKLVTSLTMTVFYLLLFYIWQLRYHKLDKKNLTITIYLLAILRIALCLFPQNEWLNYNAPLSWGIYRNLPFLLMGLIIIYIFYKEAKEYMDTDFKYMWFAIVLSFAFYVPVVLFADTYPLVGTLMIPKTLAYVWVVWMGYKASKKV